MSDRPRPGSGLVAGAFLGALLSAACAAPRRPSIVLITIDTLRADHLGCYGYARPTSPRLDALAREGVVVERVGTTLPRTTPSVASILTGRLPKTHGTRSLLDHLSATNTTLAEILGREGYDTAAFTSGAFLRPGTGFEQGFDQYDNPEARWDGDSSEAVSAAAAAWIAARPAGRPFFLWVHYLDPLWRYDPGESWVRRFAPASEGAPSPGPADASEPSSRGAAIFGAPLPPGAAALVTARYDGEIARTDAAIGTLLDRLAGAGSPLITVVTSDHGESLGEHGYRFAHGDYLYEGVLRVPLLVRFPGVVAPGTRAPGPALNIDVAPTILTLAGVGGMQGVEGRPLLVVQGTGGARRAAPSPGRPLVWAEGDPKSLFPANPRRFIAGAAGRWTAAGDGRYKLIVIPRPGGESLEMYDLEADPGESRNRVDDPDLRDVRARLYRAVKGFADYDAGLPDSSGPDPESLRLLGSLGYFH